MPKEIVDQGFDRDTDAYANAFTITIVKPGVSLSQVKQSLEIVLMDIAMRLDAEKEPKAALEEVKR